MHIMTYTSELSDTEFTITVINMFAALMKKVVKGRKRSNENTRFQKQIIDMKNA